MVFRDRRSSYMKLTLVGFINPHRRAAGFRESCPVYATLAVVRGKKKYYAWVDRIWYYARYTPDGFVVMKDRRVPLNVVARFRYPTS